jgi:hypothetical protein
MAAKIPHHVLRAREARLERQRKRRNAERRRKAKEERLRLQSLSARELKKEVIRRVTRVVAPHAKGARRRAVVQFATLLADLPSGMQRAVVLGAQQARRATRLAKRRHA